MPFVERDGQGKIIGLFANKQGYAQEFLADSKTEIKNFVKAVDLERAKSAAKRRVMDAKIKELCAEDIGAIDALTTVEACEAI